MASLFKNEVAIIGTTLAAVGTVVATDKIRVAAGFSMCNVHTDTILVDLAVRISATDYYVVKDFAIPAGETFYPWGALAKKFLEEGSQVYAKSNVAASLHISHDFLERDQV